eukprot:TRINITY_DN68216_c0_g1_i1.p1 TRINITY_DN68216_c0_g1~~TRINITY_DN68216_c0_g1_i1.p1  ORF type:complete len:365 (-),score=60.29 TRINITY_DN68216_c0_g1_i1:363-1457(-)
MEASMAQSSAALRSSSCGSAVEASGSSCGTHPFMRSKFQVGSVKSQKVNFSLAQKVFHSVDAPEVVASKRAVMKSKQSNILGTEQRDWNQSTIVNQKVQKDPVDLKCTLLKVRAGLVDEKVTKPPKNHSDEAVSELHRYIVNSTGQGPIGKCTKKWFNAVDERGLANHVCHEAWGDWNQSTATHTKEDVKQGQAVFEAKEQRRVRMQEKDPKLCAEAYVDPMTATANVNDRLRERKVDFQDLKEQFKRELKVEFPRASEERLQAMAQRLLNEKLLADEKTSRFPVQHENFRPNLSLTTQDRRYKQYHHPGTWTWSEVEKCYAWSCCLNFKEASRGCEHKVVNPDAWCTLGFERRPGMAATVIRA